MNVFTWGSNQYGELGFPSRGAKGESAPEGKPHVPTPRPITGATDDAGDDDGVQAAAVAVAAGANHTLLVTARGDVYAFGRNKEGQLGQGRAAGRRACASRWPRTTWRWSRAARTRASR